MNRKQLLKSWKYKLMLFKAYFEHGYSFMSYPKWVVAIFGIGEVVNKNYNIVIIGAFIFFISCVVIGWLFIKWGFYEAQQEVSNQFNLFVKELRKRKTI
ncbi:unnamed protein product [marine sediment metagenome]|uniref:Uncharacterized protein n=1 Tax=marine sediment metagenome TaxID=412755 RepID=X0TB24_9ZZZZ